MEIIKLIPRGFCKGVVIAIKSLDDAIKNYPNKNIYCMGWIVHNKDVVDEFIKKNVKFLDDKIKSRLELIEELNDKNAVVVFSAHGTNQKVIDLAKQKGIITIVLLDEIVCKVGLKNGLDVLRKWGSSGPWDQGKEKDRSKGRAEYSK